MVAREWNSPAESKKSLRDFSLLSQEIHFLAFSHEGFIWALGRESDGLLASILPFRLGYQEP